MKKLFIIVFALMTATTMFALPPPNVSVPKRSTGPRIVFRQDTLSVPRDGVSKSPNRQMANAVAISGFAAMGARLIQEIVAPPQPTVIVVPEGTETPIIVKEMEPVVKHPVPIDPLPIEVMISH